MAEETITAQTPEIDPGMSVMPEAPGLMDVPTVIPELGLAAQALASQVSFAKKTWKDGSGGGTPVTAAELNRLEQGVADLTAAVNALRDSVSQIDLWPTILEQDKFTITSVKAYQAGKIVFVGLDITCKNPTEQFAPETILRDLPKPVAIWRQTVATENGGWARIYANADKSCIDVVSTKAGRFFATFSYPCE